MIDGVRPEVALVCRSIAPAADEPDDGLIESLLGADLEWEFLLGFARRHGVLPLLHRRLVGAYGHRIGDGVRSELDAAHRSQAVTNLQMEVVLHELLERLDARDVRALPIKGPVLAAASYGARSRRSFADLDVLVHEADVSRALDVMDAMGYERPVDAPRLDDAAILGGPLTPPLAAEYTLQHPETGVTVELRWRIGTDPHSFKPGFETVWARRVPTTVGRRTVPSLAPDDRLLYLSYHGCKHAWALLKWVADVAWTIDATPDLDWPVLFRRARSAELTRRLVVGLGVTAPLLDVEVQGLDWRLERDPTAAALVTQVHERLAHRPLQPFDAIDTRQYHLSANDSVRARLASQLSSSPVHPSIAEYRLLPLPGPLHPVYYLLRPLRLLVVYGVLDRVRSDS